MLYAMQKNEPRAWCLHANWAVSLAYIFQQCVSDKFSYALDQNSPIPLDKLFLFLILFHLTSDILNILYLVLFFV